MPTIIFNTFDDPSATLGTQAWGVNDTDQIVGYYLTATENHGFLLSGGVFIPLDDPLATQGTTPTGINATGQIVGAYGDATGNHGFLYNPLM